ncbi:sister chromatid cohesion protein DCC1-like [Tubulanus polymorphus]|uniref:sister chromatid cohesion protein DCC1-like n=1 Tax=Tubulanus polymorphus TaxID=672921 RepID=UPI003DA5DA79
MATTSSIDELAEIQCSFSEKRSLERIHKIVEYAKLDPSELKPTVQSIYFAADLDHEDVKLIELDDDVYQSLKKGDRLSIRGEKHEGAVLCTSDKTYNMKEAETSNSLLLLPTLDIINSDEQEPDVLNRYVQSVKHQYYELKPCKPKLKKLKELLEMSPYSGQLHEETSMENVKMYTYDELLDVIQASEDELMKALKALQVCTIDGKMRILEFDYLSQVLSSLFLLLDEKDWSYDAIPGTHCCEILADLYPKEVVLHVLNCYSDPVDDVEGAFCFNEHKVCRFHAEILLRHNDKFNFQDFMKTWNESVPQNMNVDLLQIQGLALIDRNSKPETITYFPVSELPENVSERFAALFKAKEKWSLDEITPYIVDLSSESCKVSALLTKNCRTSTQNGIKMFSSRQIIRV